MSTQTVPADSAEAPASAYTNLDGTLHYHYELADGEGGGPGQGDGSGEYPGGGLEGDGSPGGLHGEEGLIPDAYAQSQILQQEDDDLENTSANHGSTQYEEFHHITQKNHELRTLNPASLPRPRSYRDGDTFYVKPVPPSENNPSMQTQFLYRSLDHAEEFPLHLQKLMGQAKRKKHVQRSFGDSEPRVPHIPNFRPRSLSPRKPIHDYKAFYEGRTMEQTINHSYPNTVFVTPGMNPTTGRPLYSPSSAGSTTRSFGSPTRGVVEQDDVLYKFKRAYTYDPASAPDPHGQRDYHQTLPIIKGRLALLGSGGDEGTDPSQLTFRPTPGIKPKAFHPPYATGKTVSSTYAMVGQVSYLPPDTDPVVHGVAKRSNKLLSGVQPAGVPAEGSTARSLSATLSGTLTSAAISAAPRPTLKIAVHPTRFNSYGDYQLVKVSAKK